MKITLIHKETTIIVDESDNEKSQKTQTSMRWSDQNESIQKTLEVMCEQVEILIGTAVPKNE